MAKATENLILDLVRDYEDYLSDLTYNQLLKISKSGCFTLKAIELEDVDPR